MTTLRKLSVLLASAALIGCAGGANSTQSSTSQSLTSQSAPSAAAPTTTQTPPPAEPATPAQPPSEATQDPTQTSSYSDTQLNAFVEASEEVQPLTEGLATATPDVRARNTVAISAALQRHGLDAETYNNIATAAQTDSALAARIAALQEPASQDSTPATPPGGN